MPTETGAPSPSHPSDSVIEVNIVLVNNTQYTLTLSPQESRGLGGAAWPSTIPPNTQATPFQQGGTTQVKFNAVYNGSGPSGGVMLEGYWTLGWLHSATINPGSPDGFPGSNVQASTYQAVYTLNWN